MIIKKATYLTSAVDKEHFIEDGLEFAFVGRSNVGKSSFINSITQSKNLAKTSGTPGRTRMVNYFLINESFRFVDLPGYGYAKAGQKNKEIWASLMEEYLLNSKSLKRVFLLVDLRHDPTPLDKQMMDYLFYHQISCTIIATKADKLPKSKLNLYCQNIAKGLNVGINNVIAYSSENGYNKEQVLNVIRKTIDEEMQNNF